MLFRSMDKEKITGAEFREIYSGEIPGNYEEVNHKDYELPAKVDKTV